MEKGEELGVAVAIRDGLLRFFFLQLVALCIAASYVFLNLQATLTLVIFNFLFGTLTFQLDGSSPRKLCMLAAGNFVGLFWNFVFFYFAMAGAAWLGGSFDAFYTVAYPILNLLWIVPFWSLGLGLLPRMQTGSSEVQP